LSQTRVPPQHATLSADFGSPQARPEKEEMSTLANAFRRPAAWSAFALSALLGGCLGGTGTDTENGLRITTRVVDESQNPIAGVTLSVMDMRSRTDSLASSPLLRPDKPIVTDQDGIASFYLKDGGDFIASGRRGDSVIFIDTIRAPRDPGSGTLLPGFGNQVFTREPPVRGNGRVRLLSGQRADSGRVYVLGTSLLAVLDTAGGYDLSWVPAATERMKVAVVYAADPAETVHVKIAARGGALVAFAAGGTRCLASPLGAATPADSTPGNLSDADALARLAGAACRGRTGALVQLHRADDAGAPVEALGTYLIADASAPVYGDS